MVCNLILSRAAEVNVISTSMNNIKSEERHSSDPSSKASALANVALAWKILKNINY